MIDRVMSDWDKAKAEHLELSNTVADKYDELYEDSNFATGSYMRFELETISRAVSMAPASTLAVDLGCGTGRDTLVLAKYFDQVYGYDFSSEMVRVANRKKLASRSGNVLFEALDVETQPLPLGNETASLVNSGFGMGSFLKMPETVFREVRRILQPRGIAIFSFYNSDALVNGLQLEWRPALAARVLDGQDRLRVEFGSKTYEIAAKAYSLREARKRLEGNFKLLEIFTYPTLSALFPQALFASEKARELCTRVDQLLASNTELAAGPYIIAVCQKGGDPIRQRPQTGYSRVLELLRFHQIPLEIREHGPVRNMQDVRAVLDANPSEMAKSILVAVDPKGEAVQGYRRVELYLVAVPADRKVDLGTLARILDKRREHLRFATQLEVEDLTEFQVGSIPPFGMPKNIPIILDSRLAALKKVWCGTGKATESLRLSIDDLKKLSTFTVADISRPDMGDI